MQTLINLEKRLLPFVIALFIWLIVAIFHLLSGHFDALKVMPEKALQLADFYYYCSAYSLWAILCGVLYLVCKKHYQKKVLMLAVTLQIILIVVWIPFFLYIDSLFYAFFYDTSVRPILEVWSATPLAIVFFYTMLTLLCLMACMALVANERSKEASLAQLRLAKTQAEQSLLLSQQRLQILQAQLSPHFLFNCLSAISALGRKGDADKLLTSVSKVASLLRYANQSSKSTMVLLDDELVFVHDYIDLQALRFSERFEFSIEANFDTTTIRILPFILQPLVENVFHHAVSNTEHQVNISLKIQSVSDENLSHQTSDVLQFTLTNDHASADNGGWGSSIQNLKERLAIAYPDQYRFSLKMESGTCTVKLRIPLSEPDYAN